MDPQIAEVAQRYAIPEAAARAFDALFRQRPARRTAASTVVEGYDPVTLALDAEPHLPDVTERAERIGDRYVDLGRIGSGGMGEVRRVLDTELHRVLAMKILHERLLDRPHALRRFLEEAQATAQLQHPNIVPVHDMGTLPDGRIWFTMKEIRGRTLAEVIAEVHAASDDRWKPAPSRWTFKRVVASYLQVCHAMAYAHERGVVHRDLKPDNVMVGQHGETWVLDWGLAKVLGRSGAAEPEPTPARPATTPSEEVQVVTTRSGASGHTRLGTVAGTPAYMAPEQARGRIDRIDARTDVYALGAMLYEILAGQAPYRGRDGREVLERVQAGPPPPIRTDRDRGPPLPEELLAACERAMARDPDERFQRALDLATEIEAWLDGARKRDQALAITERALAGVDEARAMRARARDLQARGEALLEDVPSWRPEEDKLPGWALQDEAAALRREAELKQLEVDRGLHGALRVAPDLPEAHAALAERYRARHAAAEQAREPEEAARSEAGIRFHLAALPAAHPTRQRCAAYLDGTGALTLHTDPPGAEVRLYRYALRHRRLRALPFRALGRTPLRQVPLPMGSYVAVITCPGHHEVRYPLEIPRGGHWDGVAPGDREPTPIALPPEGALGPDEVYLPAGWYRVGGDPRAVNSLPARRLWCDALVIHRHPVTNRRYLAFLDELVARGRAEEALRHAPRERSSVPGEPGALIYAFDGQRFRLQPDADGDLWEPDYPVFQVDWHGARAFLAWLAERTGRPWRLPGELEWEKAARGVDGRRFPWGDHLDPSWCCMTDSHPDRRLPAVVDRFAVDTSPFGVRGCAGNVEDWCAELFDGGPALDGDRVLPPALRPDHPGLRVTRGGTWNSSEQGARLARRGRCGPTGRDSNLGFRGLYRPDFAR